MSWKSTPSNLVSMLVPLAVSGCDWLDDPEVEFTMHAERFELETGEFSPAPAPEIRRNLFDWIPTDDGILLIGGLDEHGDFSTAVEHYDPTSQTWTRRAAWPDPGIAWALWVGDRLCTLGGYDEIEADVRDAVWCYAPSSDAWTRAASLPRRYSSFYPTVVDGEIWIPGGTAIDDTIVAPVDELWRFDPVSDAWSQHADLPAPRGLASVHTLGDQIYVVGGWDSDSLADYQDTPEEAEMLVYTPATDSWSLTPQLPHDRGLYGSRVVGDELVVYFGITDGPLIEIYDPITQAWREGSEPAEPIAAGVYSSTHDEVGDRLYMLILAEGSDGEQSVSSGRLWAYDVGDDSWEVVGTRDPSQPDALFLGAVVGGAIHWVGAFTEFRSAALGPRGPARRGVVLDHARE